MHRFYLIFIAGLLVLTSCNNTSQPSGTKFTKTFNEYLTKHGAACTVIGRQFPIDLPRSDQTEQYGIGPKLSAFWRWPA
jgi:hypothetical protein